MKRYDYLLYAIDQKYYNDIAWFYTFFTVLDKDMEPNKYLRYNDYGYEVNYNGKWEKLEKINNIVVYSMLDGVDVTNRMISNVKTTIKSTVGRFFANKLLLEVPFGGKFDYIDGNISIKKLEKEIADAMIDRKVNVSEYIKFVDSVNYMKGLSRITSVSATPKNVLPPDGIEKFKKKKLEEYDKKYGPNWRKDRVKILEYKEELKKYDDEWLKDDPSYGKLTSGKIKDNSRVKMYLTFGDESGFSSDTNDFEFVEQSLLEEYPKDKEKLAAMFNASRSGSYDRGKETQKGGEAAKQILRAISSLTITGTDCGSKKGKEYTITKDILDSIKGRYIVGPKPKLIENPKDYLGKTITLRSPMYCLNKNQSFCATCVGKVMAEYKTGLALSTLNISNQILTSSLKKMHNTQLKLVEINLDNILN